MAESHPISTHWRFQDLTGKAFGRLTVISYAGSPKKRALWNCICSCGKETTTTRDCLVYGEAKSCGCWRREKIGLRSITHGKTRGNRRIPEYTSWFQMLSRCRNPKVPNYRHYGGRGITVCDRWQGPDGFANFLADMGPRPFPKATLDRIDTNANYEPENCRWATQRQQTRNKRNNRLLTCNGRTMCLSEWEEITGLRRKTIVTRLKFGWSIHDALTKPVDKTRGRRR